MTEQPLRVTATDSARALIATLRAKHGNLMFHQSGGCCDGSAPMCYPQGEFIIGLAVKRQGPLFRSIEDYIDQAPAVGG